VAHCFLAQRFISVYARHDTEDVVIYSVYTDLGGRGSSNGAGRENELEYGVVNAGEVARSAGLMLFGAKGKGVYVDTRIGVTGVVLEGLDYVEVAALTLREAVLAVELELGSYYGVLTPAVHVEGRLGEDKRARIGNRGTSRVRGLVLVNERKSTVDVKCISANVNSARELEETRGVDKTLVGASSADVDLVGSTESGDGRRKGINGIRVVEGLGTERAEEDLGSI